MRKLCVILTVLILTTSTISCSKQDKYEYGIGSQNENLFTLFDVGKIESIEFYDDGSGEIELAFFDMSKDEILSYLDRKIQNLNEKSLNSSDLKDKKTLIHKGSISDKMDKAERRAVLYFAPIHNFSNNIQIFDVASYLNPSASDIQKFGKELFMTELKNKDNKDLKVSNLEAKPMRVMIITGIINQMQIKFDGQVLATKNDGLSERIEMEKNSVKFANDVAVIMYTTDNYNYTFWIITIGGVMILLLFSLILNLRKKRIKKSK